MDTSGRRQAESICLLPRGGPSQSNPPCSVGESSTMRRGRKSRTTFLHVALVAIALYAPALTSAAPCGPSSSTAVSFVIRHPDDVTELADAVNCSGGSFSAIWTQHVEMSKPISIFGGTSLSVTGSADGASIIDGGRETQLFRVYNGSLDLTNVTMTNAAGGAIEAAGSIVNARNCTFSNNEAAIGGGIYLEGSRMEVIDSVFSNNTGSGGAMAVLNSTVVLSDHVTFLGNNASHGLWGGALLAIDSSVSIPGTTIFAGNYATRGGGSAMASVDLVVDGHVAFVGNRASQWGGGLYGDALTVRIDGSGIWEANEGMWGGGMLLFDSDVVASSCTFLDNKAEYGGGGLYLLSSTLSITGSAFTNNSASSSGGGMAAQESTITIDDDVTFDRNGNIEEEHLWGGGLFGNLSSVIIYGQARFVDNEANDGAGAFLVEGNLLIDGHMLFANNTAEVNGGGLYGENLTAKVVGGTVEWRGNYAMFGGGVFCFYFCDIKIFVEVVFAENRADMAAGIWISQFGTLEALDHVEFTSNTARDGGGGVILSSEIRFPGDSLFDSNSADQFGGVFFVLGEGVLRVSGNSTFSNNSALSGGAVALGGATRGWFLGDIFMVDNSASSSGGAVYAEAPKRSQGILFEGVRFKSNSAGVDGGAVTLLSAGDSLNFSQVINCEFEDNAAVDAGGAMFVAGGFVEVSKCDFTGNVAGEKLALRNDPLVTSLFSQPKTALFPVIATSVLCMR